MEPLELVKSKIAVQQIKWLHQSKDDTADAYFVFEEAGQSKRIPAHKIILAANSPAFKVCDY